MKKIRLCIIALLFIIPFSVFAADDPKVLSIDVDRSGSTVHYTGTTEDGIYAVMCKLYNSNNEEVDMLSSSVDNNSFEGDFTDLSDGDYTIGCARYEGGEIKKVEATVSSSSEENSNDAANSSMSNTLKNPKTYDAGIRYSVIILVISILGIVGSTIYLKVKKNRI